MDRGDHGGGGAGPAAEVTDERAFLGSRSARFNANERASGRYPNLNAAELYVSLRFYWEEYEPAGTGDGANFKYFNMSGSNTHHSTAPGTHATLLGPAGGYASSNLIGSKGSADANSWYGSVLPQGEWNRIESYLLLSSPPGTASGRRYHKQNGAGSFTYSGYSGSHFSSPSGAISSTAYTGDTWNTSSAPDAVQAIWLAFYRRDWQRLEAWADEIYIDRGQNAQARFEIGPSAGFGSNSRLRTLCPYSAWSTTQVTITLRSSGGLGGKGLYFVDNEGTVTKVGEFQ